MNKYHQLCDNICNNLIIIEIENKIFGCYSPWTWNTSWNDLRSSNGFLFTLYKNQKYSNENLRIHQGCSDHGPYIYDKFYFDKNMNNCNILSKEFIDKTGNLNAKEVEIYQII